jgi:hypothetical protein
MEQHLLSKKSFHRLLGSWFAVMMLLFCAGNAAAQTFTVDNIIYTVTSANTLTITGNTLSAATALDISTVLYQNVTYSVTGIGDEAFAKIEGDDFVESPYVTSATFPNVISIGKRAFIKCNKLTSAAFPKASDIGGSAFLDCIKLESATIPNADSIRVNTFSSCSSLTSVSFPKATSIGENAFSDCIHLTSVSFPKATSIGKNAFANCSNLTSATIPNASEIGKGAFNSCDKLMSATFLKAESIESGVFYNCSSLTSATIPNASEIGKGAFNSCGKLTSATFLKAESIGYDAFYNCGSLKSVTIPNASKIGNNAFMRCTLLSTLYLGATPPSVADGAFDGCPSHRNLILVAADGTALTGAALNATIMNYRNHAGYDVRTNLWYGWTLPELERNIAYATISLENGSFQANGSQFKPGVAVSFYGMPLTEGVDYTVTYGENINPGKGTVIITGVGNYPGSQTITFTIYAKPVYVIIPKVSDVTVTPGFGLNLAGIGQPFEFTVTPDSVLGKEGTDYTIEVRTDKGETLYPNGNSYKIAAVDHETTVYINVKKLHPTGVDNINALIVYGGQGSITIESPNNTTALVVNLFGSVIQSTTISSGKTTFNGLSEGIYIVKVGNKTEKVIVR